MEAFRKQANQIKPIGVPRTDVFFDDEYVNYTKEKYMKMYPQLRDKKYCYMHLLSVVDRMSVLIIV